MAKKTKQSFDSIVLSLRLPKEAIDNLDAEAKKRGLSRTYLIKERIQERKTMGKHDIASATKRVVTEFKHLESLWNKYGSKADSTLIMQDAKSALTYVLGRYDAAFGKPSLHYYVLHHPEKNRKMIKGTLIKDAEEKTNKHEQRYTELKAATSMGDITVLSWTSTPVEFLKQGTKVCMVGYFMKEAEFYADCIFIIEDAINNKQL